MGHSSAAQEEVATPATAAMPNSRRCFIRFGATVD
jgi:hypothetical protein